MGKEDTGGGVLMGALRTDRKLDLLQLSPIFKYTKNIEERRELGVGDIDRGEPFQYLAKPTLLGWAEPNSAHLTVSSWWASPRPCDPVHFDIPSGGWWSYIFGDETLWCTLWSNTRRNNKKWGLRNSQQQVNAVFFPAAIVYSGGGNATVDYCTREKDEHQREGR
ncbi:uncharacterized protein G2W53_000783 [Senna tora]|uniref:Uncharacterized protein n=1 Tax=Senna tora TaxID=362788 RepID=A0A834XER6_9FABA|nr:uncharacterized protein G2W53_000783 [Senna tora]